MFGFFRRKRVTFRGDLSEMALPEMLHVLYRHGTSGLITIESGKVTKDIYIKNGACIYAWSDAPEDGLMPYLLRVKLITLEQSRAVLLSPSKTDRDRGEVIIDRDILSPLELYQAMRGRIEALVWSVFWMREGQLQFTVVPEEPESISVHIPLRQVILHGVRRAPRAKELVARLGNRTTIFEPSYELADLVEVALDKDELTLLRLVNGSRSLYEICAQGPFTARENAKIVYALYVLQLIKKSEKQPRDAEGDLMSSPHYDEDADEGSRRPPPKTSKSQAPRKL